MGNQLAGTVPKQILPVEHYLQDLQSFDYDSSLGSTRFFKVARVRTRNTSDLLVVKVFVLHDPTLPLAEHKEQVDRLASLIGAANNCLPFSKAILTEKAAFLVRQFIKFNCYDRLSTRPFLTFLEKKWIAFQLLQALQFCHSKGVFHGDIKLENMLLTSWVWLLLADFASYKPALLPEDNPADFSYFFDTSRRRTCYLAPERFQCSSTAGPDGSQLTQSVIVDYGGLVARLTPEMDIFAAGCALVELFSDGQPPFDFVQLLSYRAKELDSSTVMDRIDDPDVKELLQHMIQREPSLRLSACDYLNWQRDRVFPESFYGFLYPYMQRLTEPEFLHPDRKIDKIYADVNLLIGKLAEDNGLLLLSNVILSSLRSLQYMSSKLEALEILERFCPYISDDIILDRFLPYVINTLMDPSPRVRSAAIEMLKVALAQVKNVPRSDANVFIEYILPPLTHLTQDESVLVRCTLAKNMASLAEISMKFLELSHWRAPASTATTPVEPTTPSGGGFESELQALQEAFQPIVLSLLTDMDSQVKRTLLEFSVAQLCVFFGRQKANDVIFSHVITFLNDKNDRHLRGSFFKCLVGVAAYVGWHSAPICKPLLQQGLCDAEEWVVVEAIEAMSEFTRLGLLPKASLLELLRDAAAFLVHPNLWIRHSCVGLLCCAARTLNAVDVQCRLASLLDPYMKYPVIQMDQEFQILEALHPPIPRSIWDNIVRSSDINLLFVTLAERQEARKTNRDWVPHPAEVGGPLKSLLRRLSSEGLTPQIEQHLLRMRDTLIKLHRHRAAVEEEHKNDKNLLHERGIIKLDSLLPPVQTRDINLQTSEFLVKSIGHWATLSTALPLKNPATSDGQPAAFHQMNQEWQHMFGPPNPIAVDQKELESAEILQPDSETPREVNEPKVAHTLPCAQELQQFLSRRAAQEYVAGLSRRVSSLGIEGRVFTVKSSSWAPKGVTVAHLHEHKGPVTRLASIGETSFFASGSLDGTVKIWDCLKFEGRNIANRSRQSFNMLSGGVVALTSCQNGHAVACASENNTVHVFRIDNASTKMNLTHERHLDLDDEGVVVDLNHLHTGHQSILVYATALGSIIGWDLRSPGNAWKMQHNLRQGVITSMCVDPGQNWLAVGTTSGSHVCWDLRFRLPVATVSNPTGTRILKIAAHPTRSSCFVSAVQNNNEVSIWDWESQSRDMALWASPAPTLSQTQASPHCAHGLFVGCKVDNQLASPFIITGGTDQRLRYWDLGTPVRSCTIASAAYDAFKPADLSYSTKLVDGIEILCENHDSAATVKAATTTLGLNTAGIVSAAVFSVNVQQLNPQSQGASLNTAQYIPPVGHGDVVSDVVMVQGSQPYVVSASKDGVVKVWK